MKRPLSAWRSQRHRLLALASGLSLAGSVLFGAFPALACVGVLLLLAAAEHAPQTAKSIFMTGWIAGATCNAAALYWMVGLFEEFAHLALPLALLLALLLFLAQGLLVAWALVSAWWIRAASSWIWPLCAAFVTTFSLAPSLFPWRFSTSAVGVLELAQAADLGGQPLLDVLLLSSSALIYEAMQRRDRRRALIAASIVALTSLYGTTRIETIEAARDRAPTTRVGMVQPNISIEEKHDPERALENLMRLRSLSRALQDQGAELIVWPETAHPFPVYRSNPHDTSGMTSVRGSLRVPLLVGAMTFGGGRCERYNSVVAFEPDGRRVALIDKVALMPFSEHVPLWSLLTPLHEWIPCPGMVPGARLQVAEIAGARIGILNCYEDVLAAAVRDAARLEPDFLVNVTNDAWFGDTREPHLHQLVARTRAIEARRDLLRVVNTGVSAWISATGASLMETPTFESATRIARPASLRGRSISTALGDWVTPIAYALLLALAIREGRRRRWRIQRG